MNLVFLALSLVFFGVCLLFILWPYMESSTAYTTSDFLREYERLIYERERLLENLRDLDLDFHMRKMSAEDLQDLKSKLIEETAAIYQAIESLEHSSHFFTELEIDLKKVKA